MGWVALEGSAAPLPPAGVSTRLILPALQEAREVASAESARVFWSVVRTGTLAPELFF